MVPNLEYLCTYNHRLYLQLRYCLRKMGKNCDFSECAIDILTFSQISKKSETSETSPGNLIFNQIVFSITEAASQRLTVKR